MGLLGETVTTARVRFDQQDGSVAINDLVATMTLARHVGSDGFIVSLLAGYSIEDLAIQDGPTDKFDDR